MWRNADKKKDVKEWITSTPEQTTSTTRIHSSGKWKRPPTVWVICNYDASHHQGINDSGVGLIIRNSNGAFMECGMGEFQGRETAAQAKLTAFVWAMQACSA